MTAIDSKTTTADAASADRRASRWILPLSAFAILSAAYTALTVTGYRQLRTSGFDLGIFVQQIASYAELRAPSSELLGTTTDGAGYNTLGDHFSPITALLAPIYHVFPTPLTLLIAQSVLFAVAVIPLTRWAQEACGTAVAVIVALAYGISFGLQSALNFDFHEIAFGVPIVAFSVVALGRGRWRTAMIWALPLVFVKEDMGLSVAVIGALVAWWTSGRTRIFGILTALWGLGALVVAIEVVIPALSTDDAYNQGSNLPPLGSGIAETAQGIAAGDSRAATLLLLLAITGFAALRSPLTLVAVPTVAWRFLSSNSNYWVPLFHYNAILMPILFAALIDALVRGRRDWHLTVGAQRLILGAVLVVALATLPFTPLARLAHPDGWRTDPQYRAAVEVSAMIPASARVAASNNLVPPLAVNHHVTVFPQRPNNSDVPDWIVVNTARPPGFPMDAAGDLRAISVALGSGYVVRSDIDGIEVLERVR